MPRKFISILSCCASLQTIWISEPGLAEMNGKQIMLIKGKRAGKWQLQLHLLDKNTLYMLEICDFFQKMFLQEADISPNSITAV